MYLSFSAVPTHGSIDQDSDLPAPPGFCNGRWDIVDIPDVLT